MAKGDRALHRDAFSPTWVHKDPLPEDVKPHEADEHYAGGAWECYDCGAKVVLAESRVSLRPAEPPG